MSDGVSATPPLSRPAAAVAPAIAGATSPAATAEQVAQHGWTAVPLNAEAILAGRPWVHRPEPLYVRQMDWPSGDPVVQRVQEYAWKRLPHPTYNHSMRVFYWGYAILHQQFPEHAASLSMSTWALTCLLHDIGTTRDNLRATLLSFEWYGGMLALDLLLGHGRDGEELGRGSGGGEGGGGGGGGAPRVEVPRAQAEAVAEAIIRHQDLPRAVGGSTGAAERGAGQGGGVPGRITLLGQLAQLATVYDNTGGHRDLVDAATREDVNKVFPRKGWSGCFAATIREENALKPWAHTTRLGEEAFPEGVRNNELMRPYDSWGLS